MYGFKRLGFRLSFVIKEKLQVHLCLCGTFLALADACITLQSRLGIEYAVVHLLRSTVFKGVLVLNILHRGIQQYLVLVKNQNMVQHLFYIVYLMGRDNHGALLRHVLGNDLAEL